MVPPIMPQGESRAAPESVFDIDLDSLESDYDLQQEAQATVGREEEGTEGGEEVGTEGTESFDVMRFSPGGSSWVMEGEESLPLDITMEEVAMGPIPLQQGVSSPSCPPPPRARGPCTAWSLHSLSRGSRGGSRFTTPSPGQHTSSAHLRGSYTSGTSLRGSNSSSGPPRGDFTSSTPLRGGYTSSTPLRGDSSTPLRGGYTSSTPLRGDSSTPSRGNYTSSTPLRGDYTSSTPLRGNFSPRSQTRGNYTHSTPLRDDPGTPQFTTSTPEGGHQPGLASPGLAGSPGFETPLDQGEASSRGGGGQGSGSGRHPGPLLSSEGEEERLLCLFHCNGRLGGALYSTETCRLDLLSDLPDGGPEFEVVRQVVHQVAPHFLVVSGRQDRALLHLLRGLAGSTNLEASSARSAASTEEQPTGALLSLVVRPGTEFASAACRRRLLAVQVPGARGVGDEQEQLRRLAPYVDFSCTSMVRAAGALLRYMDGLPGNLEVEGRGAVLLLGSLALEKLLTVDRAAAASLHIFASTVQLSGSRAGSWNKSGEGLSLLSLLSRCSSVVGARHLRRLLRCPSTCPEELAARHRALAFLTAPKSTEVVRALVAALKMVKNFHRIMVKLSGSLATAADWRSLQRTLAGLAMLVEVAPHCDNQVTDIADLLAVGHVVHDLLGLIDQVVDFQADKEGGKVAVRAGVDAELDEKRREHAGLPDLLDLVAAEEAKNLPEMVTACVFNYIPHVGFLVVLPHKPRLEEAGLDYRNLPDYEFMFESTGQMYYRNATSKSLDARLGDVMLEITRVEMRIVSQLTDRVLDARADLDRAVRLAGHLDCLVAFAIVSRENNWVRPRLVGGGQGLAIRGGRHPLQELTVNQFIGNDTRLGGDAPPLHLLTGPNSSGKSVYLRQVGLIVYLAHLGCWVPAAAATVPITDRILTRIHTVESVSLGMSAFQCDLGQVAAALRCSTANSLLLVDEFGKGTAPEDGEALLAALAAELLARGAACPATLLSTHFHGCARLLGPHPLLAHYRLATDAAPGGGVTYLYRLEEGQGATSEALAVAGKAGLPAEVLARAAEVGEGRGLVLPAAGLPLARVHSLLEELVDLDTADQDQVELFMEAVMEAGRV